MIRKSHRTNYLLGWAAVFAMIVGLVSGQIWLGLLAAGCLMGGLQIQGPEFFEDVPVPVSAGVITPQELITQKEIRKNKWVWGCLVEAQFHVRAATGAATPLTFQPEFPLGFIDRFRIEGNHYDFGVREFLNISGPTMAQYCNFFQARPLSAQVSFNAAAAYQAIGPKSGIGFAGQIAATNPAIASSANNDYDVQVAYLIPFVPLGIPVEQQALFMLRGDSWETLNFRFTVADGSGLFDNKTATTITFGAFGSGTGAVAGQPLVRVSLLRPNMGLARNKYKPALVWRTFQGGATMSTPLTAQNLTDGLIARLTVTPDKYVRYLVKTGVKTTDTPTAGVNASFGSLSDKIVTRPKTKLSGKLIRNPIDTFKHKEWQQIAHGATHIAGYNFTDFCETGDINSFFSVKGLTKDDFTFEGDSVAAANQIAELLEERIENQPVAIG